MQKSLRTLAIAAALSLVAAPSLQAERMGCNPRPPQGSAVAPLSTFQLIQYTVLAYLGA